MSVILLLLLLCSGSWNLALCHPSQFPLVVGFVVPSRGLGNSGSHQGLFHSRAQAQAVTFTALRAKGDNSTGNSLDHHDRADPIVSPAILVGDLLAIALASQLLGLVDVLNDPSFLKTGGWLQPINMASSTSTLPVLVQSFSILSVSWITAAVAFKGLLIDDSDDSTQLLPSTLKLLLPFSLTLITLEVAASTMSDTQLDILGMARLCYFGGSFILAGRYVMSRLTII